MDRQVHRVTDEVFWKRDRANFPVEYLSTPILEQGELVGAVVTFRNITPERQVVDRMKVDLVPPDLTTPWSNKA